MSNINNLFQSKDVTIIEFPEGGETIIITSRPTRKNPIWLVVEAYSAEDLYTECLAMDKEEELINFLADVADIYIRDEGGSVEEDKLYLDDMTGLLAFVDKVVVLAREPDEVDDIVEGVCDWCHAESDDLSEYRDREEGVNGALYDVCQACILADKESYAEEDL